jgi:hypothetical protein
MLPWSTATERAVCCPHSCQLNAWRRSKDKASTVLDSTTKRCADAALIQYRRLAPLIACYQPPPVASLSCRSPLCLGQRLPRTLRYHDTAPVRANSELFATGTLLVVVGVQYVLPELHSGSFDSTSEGSIANLRLSTSIATLPAPPRPAQSILTRANCQKIVYYSPAT